ncbi:MAG TPA: hypothetical protein PLH27_12030 [bacterium]|nr:hypothetical protein [bacterium]HMW37604.1 hypothetical protein [bacterium]HMZ05314.1 hypothetical protein [bacterium]HNB08338.1 hypothetical protein [bacterium]HNB55909.1 hypothetical protein [bacterium]
MKTAFRQHVEQTVGARGIYSEREKRQLIEHVTQIHDALLAGEKTDTIMENVEAFLDQFVNAFSTLEQKTDARNKKVQRREKKKSQLDIFKNEK